jgi:polygalacturonase
MDVPSLFNYELGQFADLSSRMVNVRDYGARGDGTTNDAAAVRSAINAGNGGTVYFPAGVYILDSVELAAGSRVRLLGAGQGTTTLKHADGATTSMLHANPQVVAQLQIESLTLDGNMDGVGSWKVSTVEVQADRLLVHNVEATRSSQQAISLPSTNYTSIIRDSWFHDFRLHGPALNQDTRAVNVDHLLASDGDVWFVNNRVEMTSPPSGPGNSVGGFRSGGHFNTRLFYWKNVFRNIGQDWPQEFLAPIDIYRNGDGSVIWQNQLYQSYYTPIRVMRSNNVQVVENTIDGEGQIGPEWGGGIDFQGRTPDINMHGIVVRGNTLRNLPDAPAITAWFDADGVMSDVTIDGNTVDHTGGAVYLSYVRGSVSVTNNAATNYGTQGLAIGNADPSSTQVTACGNSWAFPACWGSAVNP